MKSPFRWDKYSDQPSPLNDMQYKMKMRKKYLWSYVLLFFTALIFFPLSVLVMPLYKGRKKDKNTFYGIGVNIDKGDIQKELIEELGIKYLIIRMPLWEMHRIDEYVSFVKLFGKDKVILLNILQDREHIEDKALLEKDIITIFEKFGSFVKEYQLGNAINRTKWGFFSIDEYLTWYAVIQQIRDLKYTHIKLVGSSIIDFEFYYTIRTLFNFFKIRYDIFSTLLYVDRRGSPYCAQLGIFNTANKINMLYALTKLSPKANDSIYITEVNWPLSNTAPYAPTSEHECVSEDLYNKYMKEYYDIAFKSQKIQRVYWHQLIASGYGLIDDRETVLRKTKAFYTMKKMISQGKIDNNPQIRDSL